MAIVFDPTKILNAVAPRKLVEKLVTQKLTVNRAALASLAESEILSKKSIQKVALKVVKQYKATYGDLKGEGLSSSKALSETLNDKKLMVQRVQNATVNEVAENLKAKYKGEFYEWLPSDAEEPDPLHQLNYGKTFQLGVGEAPGDRIGCRCGMRILVDETELEI